jgi:threonine dehydratase
MRERINLTMADVESAAHRLRRLTWHTPLVHSAWLSDAVGAEVWLKLELVQTTGSFKLRGALNALAQLERREGRPAVVVTASAGNHGLAIGWAARHFGVRARVYLPISAPAAKRSALVRLDAELVDASTYDAAEFQAQQDAATTGATYVSPYDDPDVVAGAATVALEMLADEPALDAIVAPLGGGGLLAGTAVVAKAQRSGRIRVIGAEADASPVFTSSLAAGRVVTVSVKPTVPTASPGTWRRTAGVCDRPRSRGSRRAGCGVFDSTGDARAVHVRRLVAEGARRRPSARCCKAAWTWPDARWAD